MNRVQLIALLYLIALFSVAYGYAVGRFAVFPYSYIEPLVAEFSAFSEGHELEKDSTLTEKLKNDFGWSFDRLLYSYDSIADTDTSPRAYPFLGNRKEPPLAFVVEDESISYRVVMGAMNLDDSFWGALLLDQSGNIIHHWNLSASQFNLASELRDTQKVLYGAHVYPDGSVIFTLQEDGGGIFKVDACSAVVWHLPGEFHHAISPTEDGHFWSFEGRQKALDQNLVKVSSATGKIVERINMADVRAANPDLYIWGLVALDITKDLENHKTIYPGHGNDVDPLPANLVESFPGLSRGDLLISYAAGNLVFILDPETLRIMWWRTGAVDFQHDPDWEPDGKISVYSNNLRTKDYSDIVAIDFQTKQHTVIHYGDQVGAKIGVNGLHQLSSFGTRIITNSQQGWVYEIDESGAVIFSFINSVDQVNKKSLHMSGAWRFNQDYFYEPFWTSCP